MYLVVAIAPGIHLAGYVNSVEEVKQVLAPLGNPIYLETALPEAWAGRDGKRPTTYFVGGGLTRAMFSILPVAPSKASELHGWVLVVYESEVSLFARPVSSAEEVSAALKAAWIVCLASGTPRTRVSPEKMWKARNSLNDYQAMPSSLATLVRVREAAPSLEVSPGSWEVLLVAKEALFRRTQVVESLRKRYASELATLGEARQLLSTREVLEYLSGRPLRTFGVTYQLEAPALDADEGNVLYDLFEEVSI